MALDWSKIEFFKREEWVTDPDKVHPDVVYLMDEMRKVAGRPIIIHVAWEPAGHVEGSAHYLGLAVDFHFSGWPLLDQWLFVERFPWEGIGVYPHWNTPGLHVDLYRNKPFRDGRRWWRDVKGKYRAIDRTLLGMLLAGSSK